MGRSGWKSSLLAVGSLLLLTHTQMAIAANDGSCSGGGSGLSSALGPVFGPIGDAARSVKGALRSQDSLIDWGRVGRDAWAFGSNFALGAAVALGAVALASAAVAAGIVSAPVMAGIGIAAAVAGLGYLGWRIYKDHRRMTEADWFGLAGNLTGGLVAGLTAGPAVSKGVGAWIGSLRGAGTAAPAPAAGGVLATLEGKSHPFTSGKEIPGGARGVINSGQSGRYLRTVDIQPSELPYASQLRPAQPIELPKTFQEIPKAPVAKVTDVVFASDENSGSSGVVKLGVLTDGTPVAVKTYYHADKELLDLHYLLEARSVKLFSDLGIGPKFYGVFQDPAGRLNLVTDVVPGDFSGTPVTAQTFGDLETILGRLRGAGVQQLGEFQPYRTPEGRLLAIDPGGVAGYMGREPFDAPDSAGGDFTSARYQLFGQADPATAQSYLDGLRQSDPAAYQGLTERIGAH